MSWWSAFDVKSDICTRVEIDVAYRFHVYCGILRILFFFLVFRLFLVLLETRIERRGGGGGVGVGNIFR